MVLKRSGERTPFDRQKVAAGVRSASKGRAVTEEQIDELAESVEDEIRLAAAAGDEVTTSLIGHAVLERSMKSRICALQVCTRTSMAQLTSAANLRC